MRGDPVPLHEQVRAQRRAVAAGVVLGVLGLAAALVSAVVAPRPAWRLQDLVVGTPSGALYVVAHDPDRLVPVSNAVAGRLVLAALRSAPVLTDPVLVDDGTLAGVPRPPRPPSPGRWARIRSGTSGRAGRCATRSPPPVGCSARPCSPGSLRGRRSRPASCSPCRAARHGWSPAANGTGSTPATPRSGPLSGSPAASPGPRPPAWSRPCPRGRRWSDRSCPARAHPDRAVYAHGSVTWCRAAPRGGPALSRGARRGPAGGPAAGGGRAGRGVRARGDRDRPRGGRRPSSGPPAGRGRLARRRAAAAGAGRGYRDLLDLVRRAGGGPGGRHASGPDARGGADRRARRSGRRRRAGGRGRRGRRWRGPRDRAGRCGRSGHGVARVGGRRRPRGRGRAVAAALGITDPAPAPEAALRLLPTGSVLDVGTATGAVDVPAR